MLIGVKIRHYDLDIFNNNEIVNKLNSKYNIEIFNYKNFNKYDIIICDNLNRGLYLTFISNFDNKKKLIIVPTSFSFDYLNYKITDNINKNIYAGITEHNKVYRVSNLIHFKNKFIFPLLKFNFNKIMNKNNFFKKYNIPNNFKIITYFDHRMERGWIKWKPNMKPRKKDQLNRVVLNQKIIMNFKKIFDNFYDLGYIIILRLYKASYSKNFNEHYFYKYYKNLLIYDDDEDIRCIFKYTSFFMIASPSSTMHISYLYDKKTSYILEEGKYDWIQKRLNSHYNKKKYKPKKQNLLCGPICYYNELINNPSNIIKKVNDYNFENIDKNNHVLLGNSYNIDLDQYCNLLADKIEEVNNKN